MARKKRADGRVQVQIDLGITPDGRRQRKSFYGRTLAAARMERDAWLEDQKQRKVFAEPDITLQKWGDMWLESIKSTTEAATYRQKKSAVGKQNGFVFGETKLGDMPVRDIRPLHIQSYLNSLSGMSKGTIKHRRFVLHTMLDAAVANRVIDYSPWSGIKAPKGTYKGHKNLDEFTQKLILDTCEKHRCGIWALTMMFTGIRREELAALNVEDVDLVHGQIHVHAAAVLGDKARLKEPKTEAGNRIIPILSPLLEPLKSYIGARKNGVLFVSASGKRIAETAFRRAWDSYLLVLERRVNGIEPCEETSGFRRDRIAKRFEDAGKTYVPINRITPHDLRYTYATILYDAGVDVKTAAYLLGHSDITVTMRIYTQLSARKKLKGMDALNGYMRSKYLQGQSDHHLTTIRLKIVRAIRKKTNGRDPNNQDI